MFASFSKYTNTSIDEEFAVKQIGEFEKYAARYNRLKRSLQGAQTAAERAETLWENMFDFFMYLMVSNFYGKVPRKEDSSSNSQSTCEN